MTGAGSAAAIAEVRTLQVGARQVTLSVFRQLDRVEPGEIEPFGRVRDGTDDADVIEVVGSRAGVLARSATQRDRRHRSPHADITTCPEALRLRKAASAAQDVAHSTFGRHEDTLRMLDLVQQLGSHREHAWHTYEDKDAWDRWTRLELIVLAGLR